MHTPPARLRGALPGARKLYHDSGYITSGAVLPDQEVDAIRPSSFGLAKTLSIMFLAS
jgi:hypothetical protein